MEGGGGAYAWRGWVWSFVPVSAWIGMVGTGIFKGLGK